MSLIQYFQNQIETAPKKLNDRGDIIPPLCFFLNEDAGISSILKVAGAEDSITELEKDWEYVEMSTANIPKLRKKS